MTTETFEMPNFWHCNFPNPDENCKDDNLWAPMRQRELECLLPLRQLLPFLLWLRSGNRCYFSKQAETYAHVGSWVRQGFVVARFTRGQYADAASMGKRQVSNYVRDLENRTFIKVVQTGTNSGATQDSTPLVAIVGIWTESEEGGKRSPLFAGWRKELDRAADDSEHEGHEWARGKRRLIESIKRENRKGVK